MGPRKRGVDEHPEVDVDEVVDAHPRGPLPPAAQPAAQAGKKERVQDAQDSSPRRLHDTGAHLGGPQAAGRSGGRGGFPLADELGQEPSALGAGLGEELVPVVTVVTDGRGAHEASRAVPPSGRPCGGLGEPPRRLDAAGPYLALVPLRKTPGDRRPGEVHNSIGAGEHVGAGVLRHPLALVRAQRGSAHEADDPVAAAGQERREGRTDQPRRARHGNGERPRPPTHDRGP